MESGPSRVSAVLHRSAYVFLLLGFACFISYAGMVGWNLDEPPKPIEKVALALAIVAFVLGLVCIAGAGSEAFGRRYSPERRRRYNRSALISLAVTAFFGLLFIRDWLWRDYDRPGGLQELFRTLLPWLLLAGVTALVGGLAIVLVQAMARPLNAED